MQETTDINDYFHNNKIPISQSFPVQSGGHIQVYPGSSLMHVEYSWWQGFVAHSLISKATDDK